MGDDAIYVAVNQDVRESKANLLWTLKNFQFQKLVLLHVHAPFSLTTSSCGLQQSEIDAIQESEVKTSKSSLKKYRVICTNNEVSGENVDILCNSGYGVGEEIVNLICQNNIEKLVMGAAADPHYSRGMSIKSRKAKYVSEHAPRSCKMWFICKGKLITTKQGSLDFGNPSNGEGTNNNENEPPQEQPDWTAKRQPVKPGGDESEAGSTPSLPNAYKCPITWNVMRDPHQAADGYTYEAEAFRKHLREVSKNSPITGLPLDNYNLTPNRILRTLINEWLEKHPNYED